MATEKTDVVIVGMGAVGGILAAELGKAGMKVVGLERGPRLTTADFNPHDELRYFQRQDLRPKVKRQPVTWRPNANARANRLPFLNYGNLEPYYDRAEYDLGVSGKAGNLQGRKIDGGNVFEAARRRDYPLPPLLADQGEMAFEGGTRKLG